MLIDIVMPQMGESLAEGTVVRWMKKASDRVEPLFEITTDKVDTDVPSPTAGTLHSILVPEGDTIAVGGRVAVIDDGAGEAKTEEPGGHFKNAHAPQLVSFRRVAPAGSKDPPLQEEERPDRGTRSGGSSHPPGVVAEGRGRSFSPAVLGLARGGGVSLQALTSMRGSGRGGRVTKADVARLVASEEAAGVGRQESEVRHRPFEFQPATPDSRLPTPAEYVYRPSPDDRVVPMSPVRKKIADHMTWSMRVSPHVTAFAECDMTAAVDLVRREREAFAVRAGAPLTFTVLIAEAFARVLREFPMFNASVVDQAIVLKPRVHLGVAVALPDSDDLIVPVVRNADGLSVEGMAVAMADLAVRARERRLKVDDVQGGTVTLTNPGMFGGLTGTPILNQPQVAILGVGAIVRRAVVLDDDSIVPRSMMTLSLTFDHRAADGMAAFKLLGRLKARLEAVAGQS
jgi:pyruvate dehydrogenase E2 component (dihydrolipoamide acetyltransferase)